MINFSYFPKPFNPTWKEILIALAIVAGILILSFADNFSDNPQMNPYGNKNKIDDTQGKQAYQIIPARTYQLELGEDVITIWDGNRFVCRLPFSWEKPSALDSLIQKDNQ